MSTLRTGLNPVELSFVQTESNPNKTGLFVSTRARSYMQQETVDPGSVHGSSLFIINAMYLSLLEVALLLPCC